MISLNQFTIKRTSEKTNLGVFEVGPLPKGYGHTLGTYLRRVLLSSIPGSAITGIKLDGANHEYTALDNIADDVLTIILSLKNVAVVNKTNEPQVLEIEVKGKEGTIVEVKASDIQKNNNVEIINPEYVITKITGPKGKFKAQLTVERGIGYKLAKDETRSELGFLPIDSNFSPVKLVNYEITPTRVGKETELDQLNLSIKTNGAVTPIEALNVAADILNQATSHLLELSGKLLKGDEITVKLTEEQKMEETKNTFVSSTSRPKLKVSDLNLSTRLTNALLRSGYTDLSKLEGMTEEEVANIRGMGSKSLTELLDILKKYEIKLI